MRLFLNPLISTFLTKFNIHRHTQHRHTDPQTHTLYNSMNRIPFERENLTSLLFSQLTTFIYPTIQHIDIYLFTLLKSSIHLFVSLFERKLPLLFELQKHSNNNPEIGHESRNRSRFYTLLYRTLISTCSL